MKGHRSNYEWFSLGAEQSGDASQSIGALSRIRRQFKIRIAIEFFGTIDTCKRIRLESIEVTHHLDEVHQ